ncbi:MAG: carbohydrate binding domain-containing protein [Woeseiaceae bacterium]
MDRCSHKASGRGFIVATLSLAFFTSLAMALERPEFLDDTGFRPHSPRSAAFVESLDSITIAVHPTMIRRARRTAHSFDSQAQFIDRLNADGITALNGTSRIDPGPLSGGSQWDVFQADMAEVAEAVKGRQPAAQYHLVLEFLLPVTDQQIFGIECYVLDQQGNNVMSFLLNAHHRSFVAAGLTAADTSEKARSAMNARATTLAMNTLQANIREEQRKARRMATLAAGDYEEIIWDDFESPVEASKDSDGLPVGFISVTDGLSTVDFSVSENYPPRPGASDGNQVLQLDMDIRNWAAFAHFFYYQGPSAAHWAHYDWRGFDGIAFWLYGRNTGNSFFVDLIDNRNPGTTTDDAERYVYVFEDDFSDWRRIAIPFDAFVRKDVGNGAPNDGLGLAFVHGWAIGATATDGPVTYYVDDFSLLYADMEPGAGTRPEVEAEYPINELPMYGLRDKTPEQLRADEAYIRHMTRGGRSREASAEVAAKNAWNVFYRGDKAAAIRRFNQAWLLDPDNQLALWGFAVTAIDRGDWDAALRYYRMAIESGPENLTLERDYNLALLQVEKIQSAQP